MTPAAARKRSDDASTAGEPGERVFVLGAGRVGAGIALALARCGVAVDGIWDRRAARLRELPRGLQVPSYCDPLVRVPWEAASIILVCVSDTAIEPLGAELAASGKLRCEHLVAHTSGAVAARALSVAPAQCASIHPVLACSSAEQAARDLPGADFGLEGAATARQRLHSLVQALGGVGFSIDSERKAEYHAACVLASNLVVALLGVAREHAALAGLSEAERPLVRLARGALQQAANHGLSEGLSGPIVRGDTATIQQHLSALGNDLPLYRRLSRAALRLAAQRQAPVPNLEALAELLGDAEDVS